MTQRFGVLQEIRDHTGVGDYAGRSGMTQGPGVSHRDHRYCGECPERSGFDLDFVPGGDP